MFSVGAVRLAVDSVIMEAWQKHFWPTVKCRKLCTVQNKVELIVVTVLVVVVMTLTHSCSRCNYRWEHWWRRGNIALIFEVGDYGQLHSTQRSVQLWFWWVSIPLCAVKIIKIYFCHLTQQSCAKGGLIVLYFITKATCFGIPPSSSQHIIHHKITMCCTF
jgi:hypothetical protein